MADAGEDGTRRISFIIQAQFLQATLHDIQLIGFVIDAEIIVVAEGMNGKLKSGGGFCEESAATRSLDSSSVRPLCS